MSALHDIWICLSPKRRASAARAIRSSEAYLRQVAAGYKMPSLLMAVKISRELDVSIDDMVAGYEQRNGVLYSNSDSRGRHR